MNELVDIQKRFIVRYAVLLTESDVQEIIRIAKANNIQIRLASNRERQIYLEDANTNVLTKIHVSCTKRRLNQEQDPMSK